MIKKLVIVAVCGGLAFAALRGTKLYSYARQGVDDASEWAAEKIPPEKEIKRLRGEVKQLDSDVLKVAGHLAHENVEVRELRQTVTDMQTKQAQQRDMLRGRGVAIKEATENVAFGGRTMPVAQAKMELEESVHRFTANQKTLASLELTLASRERTRDTLEKQLDTLKGQKKELAGAIDALEAEVNLLKLQQMESKYQCDDTRLSEIKSSIRDLRKRIDVKREQLKLAPAVHEEKPVAAASNRSVDEILAGLGVEPKTSKTVSTD